MSIEILIKQFHDHYAVKGWDKDFHLNKNSWLREYGESDRDCLKKAFLDWIDAQGGQFLKAPLPADVRPYYNALMERLRTSERLNDKPAGVYAKVCQSQINFKLVTDDELRHRGEQILMFRNQRYYNQPGQDCPMYKMSQSIVDEYQRRFAG